VSVEVLYLPVMAGLLLLGALTMVSWGGWRLFNAVGG
jgi:hypothetical protein